MKWLTPYRPAGVLNVRRLKKLRGPKLENVRFACNKK